MLKLKLKDMKQITFLITVIVLIFVQPDVLAQSLFTTQTKQFGDVEVVTKLYGDEVSNITIIIGKRSYQVDNFYGSFTGQKIVGDIKFPKKK